MTDQTDYPFAVSETDHLWIEMPDGVRLAGRLWRPVTQRSVPAILEYIPYRKTDMVRARDERNHPYFAAHGYACIRVDMRGSGDSEGHMPDMYAPAELDDARHVIEWLAAQPWCNGRVGMFGTSWGGTASLQASVNAPEPLKATIAVCATHDRFEDDIHYMGGCVLSDTFEWGATLPSILASPPSMNVGPDWKTLWKDRIDNLTFPLANWLREDGRGDYWHHGSVIHTAGALSVPILSVGGWSDRYSNSVMSLVDARPDLVWGVVGPWGHHYPDHGSPGPAIGFQKLALEWWDHWLKSDQPDTPDWPRLRVWMREFDTPRDTLAERTGQWVESGPTAQATAIQALPLNTLRLASARWDIPSDPTVGQTAGDTGYFGRLGGLPLDQGSDDALSLVFETEQLAQDMILYGAVSLSLQGKIAGQPGKIIARLSDVDSDGVAARISYGIRKLALDENLDHNPANAAPGDFSAEVKLHTTAYRMRKGHSIRLALSSAYWPLIHGQMPTADIQLQSGTLRLPVMQEEATELSHPLPVPQDLPVQTTHTVDAPFPLKRWKNTLPDRLEMGWHQPMLKVRYAKTDTIFGYETSMLHHLSLDGAAGQETRVDHQMVFERSDGVANVRVFLVARTAGGKTTADLDLAVSWNDQPFAARNWRLA